MQRSIYSTVEVENIGAQEEAIFSAFICTFFENKRHRRCAKSLIKKGKIMHVVLKNSSGDSSFSSFQNVNNICYYFFILIPVLLF